MAVNLKANVPKAIICDANLIGRFTSLYHAGHGHLVTKNRNLCECTADGFKGKGWHFGVKYEDGAIGCATLASVREKLVPLAASVAPETPRPVVAKKWKSHEIKKLNWLVELETQVKIGDSIYTGIVEKICHCKRKEIVKNGWHFHIKYIDGDQGCACVEDVCAGVIDTMKIPRAKNSVDTIIDTCSDSRQFGSFQDCALSAGFCIEETPGLSEASKSCSCRRAQEENKKSRYPEDKEQAQEKGQQTIFSEA
jgi:hypothetical protein